MSFKVVIPARFGSSRLPGKPLKIIGGKPMIWHVYQRAIESGANLADIVVATDERRIVEAVESFGGNVVMTSGHHESGTERLAEVASLLGWGEDELVVNLQGDEPLIPSVLIRQLAKNLHDSQTATMATLATPFGDREMLFNPNVVKVVCDVNGAAHYFSRSPLPHVRDDAVLHDMLSKRQFLRHIGMYAYRVKTLAQIIAMDPSPLEAAESLEQLRPLYHGTVINVAVIDEAPPHGVDTFDDLERIRTMITNGIVKADQT